MQQKQIFEYRKSAPRPALSARSVAVTVMVFAMISAYLLHKLEHLPYRPPMDMSAFLGETELAIVRVLKWLCIAAVPVAFTVMVMNFRRTR